MSSDVFNKLQITQTHRLQLNPQLLQSMSVLCMNTAELNSYIDRIYQENPCIDKSEPVISEEMLLVLKDYRSRDYAGVGSGGDLRNGAGIRAGRAAKNRNNDEAAAGREPSSRYVDDYIDSLSYELKSQIDRLNIDSRMKSVCEYLTDQLEDNGWLTAETLEAAVRVGVPRDMIREAAELIKTLEPAGVGAENLSEFIQLQLKRIHPGEKLALRMAEPDMIEAVSKQNYRSLAAKLDTDIESVLRAAELIAGLSSSIVSGYGSSSEAAYVFPDVYIYVDRDGTVHAETNEYDVPAVNVSEKYLDMYKSTDDPELKTYLREKLSEAYKLISNIGRRKSSLRRCFNFAAETQRDFFTGKSRALKPMTMTDAAEELGVNVSTVSRCLMNKYVQCPQGLMPAKYFFSRSLPRAGYGSDAKSRQGASDFMARLIEKEDRQHPLSDSRICEMMNRYGYMIKRRTVAKYREELNIPDYRIRRSRYNV